MHVRALLLFLLMIPSIFGFGINAEFFTQNEAWVPIALNLKRTQGRGIGFHKSYTSLDLFLTLPYYAEVVPYLDLRGHYFDDAKWAANGGAGVRLLVPEINSVLGANAYYDCRLGERRHYQQIGVGLEWLTPYFEFTANGYIPFGKTKSGIFDQRLIGFQGHHFLIQRKRELALGGAELEVGYRWPRTRFFELYTGLGAYYLTGSQKHVLGVQGVVSGQFWRFFSIDLKCSHDHLFHTSFQGVFTVSLPFGYEPRVPYSCESNTNLQRLLYRPIERREIIALDKHKKHDVARSAQTQQPLNFVFVNNSNSTAGKGTFEDPYSHLSSAQESSSAHDVIYIHAGDGSSRGMDQGIVLKDNQLLLGSALPHMISSADGILFIPAASEEYPIISNLAGNAVELASDNEVVGLHLQAAQWAIHGNASTNGILANNKMSGALLGGGIGIENISGEWIANFNQIHGSSAANSQGVSLETCGEGQARVTLEGNQVLYFDHGVKLSARHNSQLTSSLMQCNVAANARSGLHFEAEGSSRLNATVQKSHIFANRGQGISAVSAAKMHLMIFENEINHNQAGLIAATKGLGILNAQINQNSILGSLGHPFTASTSGSADQISLQFNQNQSDGIFQFTNTSLLNSSWSIPSTIQAPLHQRAISPC